MVAYDSGIISFRELLDIFFKHHDPCKRMQGHLKGTRYDPVIFCHHDRDTKLAGEYIHELQLRGVCPGGVVTRIATASTFYKADECHQQFYEKMGTCYSVLNSREQGDVE